MKIRIIFGISVSIILLTACLVSKRVTIDNFHVNETPPNGIEISDNFYCDQTEMTNIGWMEYIYWNKEIYGSQSMEYISSLPDTLVWLEIDSCRYPNVDYYLKHPAYRNYPVVGITQKQAIEFSKWRSDRVFEDLLIRFKIIKYIPFQTKENYFTIEKYLNGELKYVISDKKVNYYPKFRLPNLDERRLVLAYSDSIDKAYFENCNTKYCLDCKEDYPKIWSDINPCLNDSFWDGPTQNVHINCASKKGNSIFNLRGNVSEWISEPGIVCGGGWKNKKEDILISDTDTISQQNAWTGFRNVSEWKRWEE